MQKISILVFAAVLFVACAKKSPEGANLSIDAPTMAADSVTVISAETDSVVAKGVLKEGKLDLVLDIEYPQMVALQFASNPQPVVFFADVAPMSVTVNFESTPPFKVTGSKYNDSLEVFGEMQNANRAYMEQLYPAYQQAQETNDTTTLEAIMATADSSATALEQQTLKFATRNGLLGAMIANRFLYSASFEQLDAIYAQIPTQYASAKDVVTLKERKAVMENTQVGKRFTDFTQMDTTNAPLSVSSIKGKFVLIDFWASWCGPCRAVNPDLVTLYNDFHPKGFEIVGVSLDQKAEDWKAAIVADKLVWQQMSDLKGWGNEGAAAYGIRSIPHSVLLDENGIIIKKNLSVKELRDYLTTALQ